jgi:CxxC motif-containing protein
MYVPKQEVTCIACPIGCKLTIMRDDHEPEGYRIEGAQCKRGVKYGIKEVTNPTRVICSTVAIRGAHLCRLPVKTLDPIPKDMNHECMKVINSVQVEAPVKLGQVIIENVLGTGVDIVATRSMAAVDQSA